MEKQHQLRCAISHQHHRNNTHFQWRNHWRFRSCYTRKHNIILMPARSGCSALKPAYDPTSSHTTTIRPILFRYQHYNCSSYRHCNKGSNSSRLSCGQTRVCTHNNQSIHQPRAPSHIPDNGYEFQLKPIKQWWAWNKLKSHPISHKWIRYAQIYNPHLTQLAIPTTTYNHPPSTNQITIPNQNTNQRSMIANT